MNPPCRPKGQGWKPSTYGWRVELYPNHRAAAGVLSEMAFYEKVIKVKADVAAYLISCFPSA